jgi:uncharacterized repeat protein (TIGR01451 family)
LPTVYFNAALPLFGGLMKKKTEKSSRIVALVLAAGLLVTLVALIAAPTLLAQDGVEPEPDGGADVLITTSLDDLEALPPEVRERLEKENGISAVDAFEIANSTKTANKDFVLAGDQVTFTILAMNSGDADTSLSVVDALPAGLTYVSHKFKDPDGGIKTGEDEVNGVVTWEGILGAGGSVEGVIVAEVDNQAQAGTEYVNTAVITAGDKTAEPSMTITVVDENSMPLVHLPVVTYGKKPLTPDIISIESTRPNSQNTWTVSWNGAGAVSYELQESLSAGFANATSMDVGPEASKTFAPQPSPFNVFYYRVRSKAGGVTGNWSVTLKVVGGYRDDFDHDPKSSQPDFPPGWPGRWQLRRTSHLDEVNAWYESTADYNAHILEVSDRWDLGITSSLMEAPSIPYAIQLEVKSVEPGWQKGLGLVFAGDKVTDNCPSDTNTVPGWYEHNDCFNEFYEFMLVEGADKKNLQVQRIHEVCWDCSPGGIPVHRKVAKNWYIEKISGISWDDYNVMRVEVRQDRIDFFAGKRGGELKHQLTIDESYYQENTYFGTISTTQEYSNSVGRYSYYEVMPLDS